MFLLKYFCLINEKHLNDETLPSPSDSLNKLMPSTAMAAVNSSINKKMKRSAQSPYLILTPAQQYQAGKRAAGYGIPKVLCSEVSGFGLEGNKCSKVKKHLSSFFKARDTV